MKKTAFVDFYSKNKISPVSQNIDDLDLHFQRRNSLFSNLGLPVSLLKDCDILEFGPGSGHNALYTISLMPKRYYLVDGNPKGLEDTEKLLSRYSIPDLKLFSTLFLDFQVKDSFDIVWAEGCIPRQTDPISILKHLSSFAKIGGVFVVSTANGISYLSETIRRLGSFMNLTESLSLQEKVSVLKPLLEGHLNFLKGRSRPVDDWIQDVILQPVGETKLLSIPEVIEGISDEYDLYGCSPRFVTDWRWYKDITGEDRNFNKNGLDSYYRNNINLLDCRFNFDSTSLDFGKELEKLSSESWIIMSNIQKGDTSKWQSFFDLLNNISNLIIKKAPETAKALNESSRWLQDGAPMKNNLESFPMWWGRGQQYLSLIRKNN